MNYIKNKKYYQLSLPNFFAIICFFAILLSIPMRLFVFCICMVEILYAGKMLISS